MSHVNLVEADLLEADPFTVQFIAHQTNCVTDRAAGLALDLFAQFPYANDYARCQNRAIRTINVFGGGIGGDTRRGVINMYAQLRVGRNPTEIERAVRLNNFRVCLQKISEIPCIRSVAFPEYIGCGLAGGHWSDYLGAIEQFARETPTVCVYIYRKPRRK